MENEKVEQYYLNEANRFVDLIFESKLFREGVTRQQMDALADVVGYYLQSYARSANKTAKFVYEAQRLQDK